MKRPCLLIYIDDQDLRPHVEWIAQVKVLDFYFAARGEQLTQLVKNIDPIMLIVDLSGPSPEWIFRHIAEILANRSNFPVVAVTPTLREDVKQRAESYGCRAVYTKADFLKHLPGVIESCLRKQF